jgi:pimeloyl-ACP methyl ester carboxylesterase
LKSTIVLIHGATLNGASWAPVRRLLEPDFTVLTPDLPGHGARRSETFTLQGAIDTVVATVKSAAPAHVILAGDSLGGYTSQASAAYLPQEQLKGLVLGGSSHEFIGAKVWPYLLKALMFRLTFAFKDERKVVAAQIPGLLANEFGLSPADVQAAMDGGISLAVFPQAVKALHHVDFRSKLAAIRQPVLFVNGDDDKLHVNGEADYVAAARDATIHRFPNCEHGVSLHRSTEFAALIRQFAARVLAPERAVV